MRDNPFALAPEPRTAAQPTAAAPPDSVSPYFDEATWNVSEASPSGIAIVRCVIYMASLRDERLWRIPINAADESVGMPTACSVGTYGRLRTVAKAPGATGCGCRPPTATTTATSPTDRTKPCGVSMS